MFRPLARLALPFVLIPSLACLGLLSRDRRPECEAYLDCLVDYDPDAYFAELPTYGPDGSCWEGPSEGCERLCARARQEIAVIRPDIETCNDDFDPDQPFVPQVGLYRFTEGRRDLGCPFESLPPNFTAQIEPTDGGFRLDNSDCTLDGRNFVCTSEPSVLELPEATIFGEHEYSGTWQSPFQLTLGAEVEHDCEGEACGVHGYAEPCTNIQSYAGERVGE